MTAFVSAAATIASVLLAPEPGHAAAPRCSDVLFVAVNGSGQPSTSMGAEMSAAFDELKSEARSRRIAKYVLPYKAAPVSTLAKPRTGLADYFESLIGGTSTMITFLFDRTRACPAETVVLAGYSQGAMVVHRALQVVGTVVTNKIAGAVLIADGDRVPQDNVAFYGTAASGASGIGHSFAALSHSQNSKFGGHLTGKIHSICNSRDLVCDYSLGSLATWQIGVRIHTSYVKTSLIAQAARAVATRLTIATPPVVFRPSGPAGFRSHVHGLTCPSSSLGEGMYSAVQPAGSSTYSGVSYHAEGEFSEFVPTAVDLAVGSHDAYIYCLDGWSPTQPGTVVKTYRVRQTVTAAASRMLVSPSAVPPGVVMTLSDGGGCGSYTATPQFAHVSISNIPAYTVNRRVDIPLGATGRWSPVEIEMPDDPTTTYWHVSAWCTSDADVWDLAADHSAYLYPDTFVPTA
jgi:hypothetical protein